MTIAHHPDDAWLVSYVAGALDLGQHVGIATHLAACPRCRAFVRAAESLGGALIADAPPAALAAGALERALARLDVAAPRAPPSPSPAEDSPAELPRFVRTYEFGKWLRVGSRVAMRRVLLPEPSPTRVFLLKAAAGTALPDHTHDGVEMTCVLSGGFSHSGGSFGPGDFELGDGSVRHTPRVDPDETCVSLVALQGDLRWKGLLGPLIGRFVRL